MFFQFSSIWSTVLITFKTVSRHFTGLQCLITHSWHHNSIPTSPHHDLHPIWESQCYCSEVMHNQKVSKDSKSLMTSWPVCLFSDFLYCTQSDNFGLRHATSLICMYICIYICMYVNILPTDDRNVFCHMVLEYTKAVRIYSEWKRIVHIYILAPVNNNDTSPALLVTCPVDLYVRPPIAAAIFRC